MTVTAAFHYRTGVLFAVDRVGILCGDKEAECPATGAYCTVRSSRACTPAPVTAEVCNQALSEADAEIGEKTKRATQKG
ncbi:hypothetical protein FACS189487_00490 [Campylobacterota bacterium]|nr:hypothetical protein FACS189487_00490 [Campylobacterota bacterium]